MVKEDKENYPVLSIWCVQSHLYMTAYMQLVWCVWKIACTTSLFDTYCLEYCNEENKRTKTSNWIVDHFSLTFVDLSFT